MVYATSDGSTRQRLRVGMVGGGRNAFIGAVHRLAMRLDDQIALVAGALSSDPENAAASAAEIGIAPERSYADYRAMAQPKPRGRTASRRSSSSRPTICTRRSPRPSSRPAST